MAELHQINANDGQAYGDMAQDGLMPAVLRVKDFFFTYAEVNAEAKRPALRGVDFTLQPGQVTLLLGKSGSGKTTLLRNLKPILAPQGEKKGAITFAGRTLTQLSPLEAAADIGFLFQNPDAQMVMETVYAELALGLENIGLSAVEIQTRIGDTVSFCGMEHLLGEKTAELSGGQKQLVNLCAVLCFRPKLLLLDEPLSQLDPESARRVVEILQRLRRETSVAILMSEQRLEDLWSLADQVIRLEQGAVAFVGSPRDFVNFSWSQQDDFGLPLVSKIFAKSGKALYHLPLTIQEGQSLLAAWGYNNGEPVSAKAIARRERNLAQPESLLLQGKAVSFAYPGERKLLLKEISLSLQQGERLVVCGSNGAGKTTLLQTIAGLIRPLQGRWLLPQKGAGGIGYLAQTSQYHFRYDTPHQEFLAIDKDYQKKEDFLAIVKGLGIDSFLAEDLYTLSVGQQQRVALAMILARPAAVYLLDEPTRGLDEENKAALVEILQRKSHSGVILATHDLEFAAAVGTSFTTLCYGRLTGVQSGADFFASRYWQTTVGARLFGAQARKSGWYDADNIPENWGLCHEIKE